MVLPEAYSRGCRGGIIIPPTSDPGVVGALWNDMGAARFSSGQPSRALLLIPFGQSNATRRTARVTMSYPSGLKSFATYGQPQDRPTVSVTDPIEGVAFDTTAAFSEFGFDQEGMAPGYAVADGRADILTWTAAIGARHYRELGPGRGAWSNLRQVLQVGPTLIGDGTHTNCDVVVIWDHGEADADTIAPGSGSTETGASQAQYLGVISDLTTRFGDEYRAAFLSPTATAPPIWGVQIANVGGDGWRNVQNAHLEAAQTIPGYELAGAKYAYEHETDGVHITGAGKRFWSEYVAHRVAEGGLPVHATAASRSGAVVTIDYATIQGDLVIDEVAVPETTTSFAQSINGFEAFVGGTQVALSAVAVSGTQATLTLAADPGAAVEVRYAQMTWPGGDQTVTGSASKMARGNLRDSGARTAQFDGTTQLYNWAVHQTITTTS